MMRQPVIELHVNDDVWIARHQLLGGQALPGAVTARGLIPAGHKIARRALQPGDPVRRYNQIIGFASCPIAPGEHVHGHNLGLGSSKGQLARDYAMGSDARPEPAREHATFDGLVRADGRVATRNYIGVLSTVNCSATVAHAIAAHFSRMHRPEALKNFPAVDGVVAITHGTGCGMDVQGQGMRVLQRTLAGYARHANFAAVLVVGLGCEGNQVAAWLENSHLTEADTLRTFNIQDSGGTSATVAAGVAHIEQLLSKAQQVSRTPCDVAHLTLGLQCGGSDGYSGVSANPALGVAADRLVAHGGTVVLSETPEIYGAEHLLTRRAVNAEVGNRLLERIRWWEQYTAMHGGEMDNNPSPGNKAGGLTTILEKSLGAVAKGGSSNLQAVYEYAEALHTKGLVFMDTPGYDPVSVTGQVAGGANLVAFTTGRGSAYGCAPAPSLKLATNRALAQRQADDIDIDCGGIVLGECSVAETGEHIFQTLLRTASGMQTRSERHGYGQNEFVPWQLGAVM